jgi:hypothetical protein
MEELRNHRVRQVVAGYSHCAALTEDGALFPWETTRNSEIDADKPVPELGFGSFVHEFGAPYRVFTFEGVRISSVAVGDGFTVAVTEARAVYSFGLSDGRLGYGEGDEDEDVFLPKRNEALDGIHLATVVAGDRHALALTRCGRVYSWGAEGRNNPVHGLGSDSNDGSDGDEGDNGGDEIDYHVPQLLPALLHERVRAIAAGPDTSCTVTDAGALHTWGGNTHGNLGHGDVLDRDRPTLVTALHGIRVVGASMHDKHTLALAADDSVYAFGKGPGLGISREGEGGEVVGPTLTPQRIPNLNCMVPPQRLHKVSCSPRNAYSTMLEQCDSIVPNITNTECKAHSPCGRKYHRRYGKPICRGCIWKAIVECGKCAWRTPFWSWAPRLTGHSLVTHQVLDLVGCLCLCLALSLSTAYVYVQRHVQNLCQEHLSTGLYMTRLRVMDQTQLTGSVSRVDSTHRRCESS